MTKILSIFLFLLLVSFSIIYAARQNPGLGTRQIIALGHMITSIVSAILIIYLAIQFRINQKKFHKEIAYLMALTGLAGLYFAVQYGFILSLSTDIRNLHYLSGFVALFLSLMPLVIKSKDKSGLHCKLATISALFAIVSIITGIVGYWDMINNIAYRLMGLR